MATARAWGTRTSNRDGQAEAITFLADPATHGGATVARVDTHISIVFLAGADAYKLKRAVRLNYLDFSTPDLRRHFCEEEVRLNRRTAPDLYQGVLPITHHAGGLALGGSGPAIDWVVHMKRFDQSQLLDHLAQSGALALPLMDALGRSIAAFHRDAAACLDRGGVGGMQIVIDGNDDGLHEFDRELNAGAATHLLALSRAELDRRLALLDGRRRHGFVRECHGDLHLGNIVIIDGSPTLFDAIEFNEDIACIDTLYDLAFLLMDLRHRGLAAHANVVWNAYLEETRDYDGIALMPLFLSCRAAVRAKISAASANVQPDTDSRDVLQVAAREYLREAIRYLHPAPPVAIAIGGVSGSGKSTAAAGLAPAIRGAPGAVVLRSDVIRKEICRAGRFDRLGADGYTSEISRRVYRELAARARQILAAGHSVIVDATFLREDDRSVIEVAAHDAGVALQGFWLDGPDTLLLERLRQRRHDPSDADATVLTMQRCTDSGAISWQRVDAENSDVRGKILSAIRCNVDIPAVKSGV